MITLDTAFVRGLPINLHPEGEGLCNMIRASGDFYEAHILDWIAARYPRQKVVVDVGANIGNHSLYWAAFSQAQMIHAFEPLPDNLALLEANVALWPVVVVHPYALSDAPGTVQMHPVPTNMGASAISPDGEVMVYAVTLDSLGLTDVTLLKVDVENHERQVLAGAQDTIARCHPLVLVEDWTGTAGDLLPGYALVREWKGSNALYRWAA